MVSEASQHNSADPYVAGASQNAPTAEKIKEFQSIMASAKTVMLTSVNTETGILHSRAMAPASKEAPFKFEFIANNASGKFAEVKENAKVNVSCYEQSSQNWFSVGGESSVSNDKARIKELWNPLVAAWFGDLGDGVHKGDASDPRVSLIVVKPLEVRYWYRTIGKAAGLLDVAISAVSGSVAHGGYLRTISAEELEAESGKA